MIYDYRDAVREMTERLEDRSNCDLMMAYKGNYYRVFLEDEAVEIYEVRDNGEEEPCRPDLELQFTEDMLYQKNRDDIEYQPYEVMNDNPYYGAGYLSVSNF